METCIYHSELSAIEHCETCQRPLCGLCLWYADDGRRLCETHAQAHEAAGGQVYDPDTYDRAIEPQFAPPGSTPSGKYVPYRGNSNDLSALIAAVVGITTVASCAGGMYCLPVVAGVLGLVGLQNARNAVDPTRTRNLSIVSLVMGALGMLPFLVSFAYIVIMFIFVLVSASTGSAGP